MIDLTGQKYTTPDGTFEIDFERFPLSTVVHALTRQCNHVTGNESISKVLAKFKVKSLADIPDEDRTAALDSVRSVFRDAMYDGTWGAGVRTRAAKVPGESLFDEWSRRYAAMHTRQHLAKNGNKAGPEKDTWYPLDDESEAYGLEDWIEAYLTNEQFGEERRARIEDLATKKVEQIELERAHKLAAAAQRTAPKKGLSL